MKLGLVIVALMLLGAMATALPAQAAIGGQYSTCLPGHYKPYLSAGSGVPPTLSSTCRPVGTGASRSTTSITGTTSDCNNSIQELNVCARAYQTTASASRSICATHNDPDGFDRDCFTVNWRGEGSAAQGAVGSVVARFRDIVTGTIHEPDTSCVMTLDLLGTTSCTAYGNTHSVWHGPDNVYDPGAGYPTYVAYRGDNTFTSICHYIRATANAELLDASLNLLVSTATTPYNTYCFQWTSSGY